MEIKRHAGTGFRLVVAATFVACCLFDKNPAVGVAHAQEECALDKPFLMSVQDVFFIQGRGTVVTGRIERGWVRPGDVVEIAGIFPSRKAVVTMIEKLKKVSHDATAGESVSLLFERLKKQDVTRGQVVAAPVTATARTKFKAEVYMLTKEEGGRHTPFFTGYNPQFRIRTAEVSGVVKLPAETDMVLPGANNAALEVELATPIAVEKGLRFILREGGRTVGGGHITEIVD